MTLFILRLHIVAAVSVSFRTWPCFNTRPPDLNIIAPEVPSSAWFRNMCCVCVREEVR